MTHERYTDPEAKAIWSEASKISLWTELELAHLSVLLHRPVECHERPSVALSAAYETQTGHDIGGFLLALEEALALDPEAQRWLHFGLTSSDIVDSANAIRVNQTTQYLVGVWAELGNVLMARPEFRQPINGRTHGQVASPTTIYRRWDAITTAVDHRPLVLPMMLTGAIGGSADRWLCGHSATVAARFGMRAETRTTQVLPRPWFVRALRQWVDWMTACEQIATDVRLMSAFGDVSEPTRAVGSSTMPGKVNPIKAEQVCGLVRIARSELRAVEDGQALWLDRDLTHSSVDRWVFPNLANLAGYVLQSTLALVRSLRVHPQPIEPGRSEAESILADLVGLYDNPRSVNYEQARILVEGPIAETLDNAETPAASPSKPAKRRILQ